MYGSEVRAHWWAELHAGNLIAGWDHETLWDAVQQIFNAWPFERPRRWWCVGGCGNTLEVHQRKSPETPWLWAIGCRKCLFGVFLTPVDTILSGPDLMVVSLRIYAKDSISTT
jgi:hypothetical protein